MQRAVFDALRAEAGADARRLRLLAAAGEVPAGVLCREPTSQLGLIPIVAIGPLGAVRTKVKPPREGRAGGAQS